MDDPVSAAGRRGLRSDRISGVLLVLIAAAVGTENRVFPLGSMAEPGPGFVPLILAVVLGAFGLLIALRGGASPLFNTLDWSEGKRGVVILIACSAAVFALERIGYRLTMIALLLFLLGVVERRGPLPTVLVAFGFAFGSYFVFASLLNVQLPHGPWGL